jgi:hypothetical protein
MVDPAGDVVVVVHVAGGPAAVAVVVVGALPKMI